MCDQETKDILTNILDASQTDDYVSGGLFTIGGGTGTYVLKSPFNTECEWSPVAVVSYGISTATNSYNSTTVANLASLARATFSQQFVVGNYPELALDFNVTALTGGAGPTVTFKVSRVGADGILYQIEQATAISAAGVISYNIGPGLDNKSAGGTIQVDMVTTGGPTSITFSASIIGKGSNVPSTNAGFIAVSSSDFGSSLANLATGAQFGLLSGGLEFANRFDGLYIPVNSSSLQSYAPFDVWQPLGRGALINVYVNMTLSTQAYLQLALRRKTYLAIPEQPRVKPHTHTHVQSRRPVRAIAGVSHQIAGFEAQYPVRERRREVYIHSQNPSNAQQSVPYNEDPANVGLKGGKR